MKRMFAGVLLVLVSSAAVSASELVWRGKVPSGQVLEGPMMVPTGACYPTIRRLRGVQYYRHAECPEHVRNHLSIGVPLYGHPIKGRKEARSVTIDAKGWVVLK